MSEGKLSRKKFFELALTEKLVPTVECGKKQIEKEK